MSQNVRAVENEWRYVAATIVAFVFTPELRRLVEWNGHFSSIDIISPLPLLMLVPIAWLCFRHRDRIEATPFTWVFIAWLVAFGYGFLTGAVQKSGLAGLYGLGLFVLPVAIGGWVLTLGERSAEITRRFAPLLLLLGGIAGVYGVVQFVVAPPWDTAWMQNVDAASFGSPVPFGIRVFGVLNGPGIFAEFLAAVLIMTVTVLDIRRPWQLLAVVAMLVSLLLSLVRAGWLELALGLIVLAIIHPSRLRAISSIVLLGILSFAGMSLFFAFSPDESFKESLVQRFDTFTQVSDDESAIVRSENRDGVLRAIVATPLGIGLGVTGVGNKLVDPNVFAFAFNPDPAIDNGYLTRLYELGIPGFVAFLAAIGIAFTMSMTAYARARRAGDTVAVGAVAVSLAFQVSIIGGLVGGDVISGVVGALYFLTIAVSASVYARLGAGDRQPSIASPHLSQATP